MTKKPFSSPVACAKDVSISDRVGFVYRERERQGTVRRKGSRYAYVECDDRREFRVPYPLLRKFPNADTPSPLSATDKLRTAFRPDDRVGFEYGDRLLEGTLLRLNPKRAHLLGDDGCEYRVPYELLKKPAGDREQQSQNRLEAVSRRARQQLDQHGLKDWRFHFDEGTRRAGCCRHHSKSISLSIGFAIAAGDEEIEETLLHEIAHALVGRNHHHDTVWRAKAKEIGCTGKRCHDFSFTLPRYIVTCENHCWAATAERRTRNAICRLCHGKLNYVTYTKERFRQVQALVDAGKRKP